MSKASTGITTPDNFDTPPSKAACARGVSVAKTILLAEDSPDDEFFFLEIIRKSRIPNPLMVVRDGTEAIAYLGRRDRFSDSETYPMPSVLFLDLRMPGADGIEVLRWIQQQPHLMELLVIILAHHGEVKDIHQAYNLGARSFLIKPFSLAELSNVILHFQDSFHGPCVSRQDEAIHGASPIS